MEAKTPKPRKDDPNASRPAWYENLKFWKWAAGIVAVLVLLTFIVRWNRSDDNKKDQVAQTTNGATVTITLAEYEQLKADAAQGKTVAATPRVPQLGQVGAMPTPIPTDPCLFHILGAPRYGSYTVVDGPGGKNMIVTNVTSVDVIPKQ